MTALTASGITYSVEIAFTTDLLTVPSAWTDVTDRGRGMTTRRGRNHELGRTQAGVFTQLLDDRDRALDPTYASSPYSPNVVPMRQFRIRATYAGTTYPVAYGFAEDWGQTWPAPAANAQGDAVISFRATDAFKVFNLTQLKSYSALVAEDMPLAWWKLDDDLVDGTVADSGSAGANGVAIGAPHPKQADEFGALRAMGFVNTTDVVTVASAPAALIRTGLTLEAWVKLDTLNAEAVLISTAAGTEAGCYRLRVNATGKLEYVHHPWSISVAGTTTITGTGWRHVAVTRDATTRVATLYLDGTAEASGSYTAPPEVPATFALSLGNTTDLYDNGSVLSLRHVQVYDYALDPARIALKAAAPFDVMPAQRSGAHIVAILDGIGWPAAARSIGTGVSMIGEVEPTGSALDWLQAVAEDTEHGVLVAGPDNALTFIGRDTLASPTVDATFGDGAGEMQYHDLELTYDDADLWTEVDASGTDGVHVVATDAAAAAKYGGSAQGARSLAATTLAATLNEVTDQANGLLNRYKAPAVRPRSLVLFGTDAITQQLSRSIGDRVTIKRRPPGGGTIAIDAIIEGIDHDASPDGWLKTTFALAPLDPQQFWLAEDAVYGLAGQTTIAGW